MKIALATCVDAPHTASDDHPMHEALIRRGIDVCIPAWDDGAVDWAQFDACVVRTTWDYTERCEAFLGWADEASQQTRLFNSAPLLRWNSHKTYLRELQEAGIPVAPTAWFDAGAEIELSSVLTERGWKEAMVKPLVGACARGTIRVRGPADAKAAQPRLEALLRKEAVMIQPYLRSVESRGELSAIFFNGRLSHALRKIPAAGDYRVMDLFGATEEEHTLSERDEALAREVLQRVQGCAACTLPLYARVDFLWADDGELVLNEVEMIEPMLFFQRFPDAADRFVASLFERL